MPKSKPKTFRSIEKVEIAVTLPPPVVAAIRESAARNSKPINYVVTDAVCSAFGIDPAIYGIDTPFPVNRAHAA